MKLKQVAKLSDLWSGEKVAVEVEGVRILLVNIDGKVHGYEDKCAHKGVALSKGKLEGTTLTCSAHGWQYDVCTGGGINPKKTKLIPVKIVQKEDGIFVDLLEIHKLGAAERADLHNHVGPVLVAGLVSDAIIAAIRQENSNVVVVDRGAYVRVLATPQCSVTRVAIESYLKKPFHIPTDLESVMVSFKGTLKLTGNEVTWS